MYFWHTILRYFAWMNTWRRHVSKWGEARSFPPLQGGICGRIQWGNLISFLRKIWLPLLSRVVRISKLDRVIVVQLPRNGGCGRGVPSPAARGFGAWPPGKFLQVAALVHEFYCILDTNLNTMIHQVFRLLHRYFKQILGRFTSQKNYFASTKYAQVINKTVIISLCCDNVSGTYSGVSTSLRAWGCSNKNEEKSYLADLFKHIFHISPSPQKIRHCAASVCNIVI
jgi:hypothetical protein